MTRTASHSEEKEPFFEKYLEKFRFQKVTVHIPQNARVLDLGCGYKGRLLQKIEKDISSGIGLDISVDKSVNNEKIKLLEHDLNNPLPFSENEFDNVISLANLEHLEDPKNSLSEICRVLKPGGKLLLTSPSTFGKPVLVFLAFLGLVSKQEIKDHKNYFNKKILLTLCQQAGFSSISHRYFQLGMNNFLTASK